MMMHVMYAQNITIWHDKLGKVPSLIAISQLNKNITIPQILANYIAGCKNITISWVSNVSLLRCMGTINAIRTMLGTHTRMPVRTHTRIHKCNLARMYARIVYTHIQSPLRMNKSTGCWDISVRKSATPFFYLVILCTQHPLTETCRNNNVSLRPDVVLM